MVVIAQGDEPERLQARTLELAYRLQHLRHSVDWTRARMEGNLHEITGRKFLLNLQQTAIDGDGLQFRPRLLPAFGMYGSRHGTIQLDTRRTFGRVDVREVSHRRNCLQLVR